MDKDNVIVCFVDMFSLKQNILAGGKGIVVDTIKLPEVLPSLCYSENTNQIHLYGNEMYIEGIIQDIRNNNQNYTNLEIKVN